MKNYQTNDIYLASYLIASGKYDLVKIEDFEGWKKSFVIDPIPTDDIISEFYNGSGTVSALKLCNQLRSLKAACQNTRGGQL
jgi:hypothetical protein